MRFTDPSMNKGVDAARVVAAGGRGQIGVDLPPSPPVDVISLVVGRVEVTRHRCWAGRRSSPRPFPEAPVQLMMRIPARPARRAREAAAQGERSAVLVGAGNHR